MIKEFSLERKIALITGAGRGLGRAIATVFAEAGADVVGASRTAAELEETAAEVRRFGRRCLSVPTDITNLTQLRTLVDRAVDEFGKVDILVNNAGLGFTKPMILTPGLDKLKIARLAPDYTVPATEHQWDLVWDTNVKSLMALANEVVPHMLKTGKGKIVNLSSVGAKKYIGSQGILTLPHVIVHCIVRFSRFCERIVMGLNRPMIYAA
ncbi:MAG: SDR family oxidoreductase [Dehalococcoidia bacterium]|jgi:NAD(P)-dependent dehydrogenase (short-subunit alcohol dehydrogenase family)